jgi:hypothetical protein
MPRRRPLLIDKYRTRVPPPFINDNSNKYMPHYRLREGGKVAGVGGGAIKRTHEDRRAGACRGKGLGLALALAFKRCSPQARPNKNKGRLLPVPVAQ